MSDQAAERCLASATGGNLTVMTSLVLTILLSFVGLAVDASGWYSHKRTMQTAVDAAAMAAAYELSRTSGSVSAARKAAKDAATRNGFPKGLSLALHADGRTVEAELKDVGAQYFSGILMDEPPELRAVASARIGRASICIHALDPVGAGAIDLVLASNILSPGCRIQVNSSSPSAFRMTGIPTVRALSICITGGVEGSLGYVSPTPDTGCPPVPDPLSTLEPPPFSGCDHVNKTIALIGPPLTPGVYCGGITVLAPLLGPLRFEPGIYVLKDGGLNLLNADVVGDGVSFYLTGEGSTINAAGLGRIRLTAPASGPLAGIVFYQDRATTPGSKHMFSVAVNKHYEGTVYLPNGDVTFLGASSGSTTSPYSIFIARRFALVGAGDVTINENYDESAVPLPPGIDHDRSAVLIR